MNQTGYLYQKYRIFITDLIRKISTINFDYIIQINEHYYNKSIKNGILDTLEYIISD